MYMDIFKRVNMCMTTESGYTITINTKLVVKNLFLQNEPILAEEEKRRKNKK